jgi:hypothetical protein
VAVSDFAEQSAPIYLKTLLKSRLFRPSASLDWPAAVVTRTAAKVVAQPGGATEIRLRNQLSQRPAERDNE